MIKHLDTRARRVEERHSYSNHNTFLEIINWMLIWILPLNPVLNRKLFYLKVTKFQITVLKFFLWPLKLLMKLLLWEKWASCFYFWIYKAAWLKDSRWNGIIFCPFVHYCPQISITARQKPVFLLFVFVLGPTGMHRLNVCSQRQAALAMWHLSILLYLQLFYKHSLEWYTFVSSKSHTVE